MGEMYIYSERVKRMTIELTTYQIPEAGQDIKVYIDALLSLKDRAADFSRSLGRVSWIQGRILLQAREQCKKLGVKWKDFLTSVGMKKETAYLLRRVATDIVPEKKDLEFTEMLAIVFPNSYGKHLRDQADSETTGDQGMVTPKSPRAAVTTQTIDKAYARLASVKNSIQQISGREFVDSKPIPAEATLKYDQALGVIDVCREELGKLAGTLVDRKKALTIPPKPTNAKSQPGSKKRKAA